VSNETNTPLNIDIAIIGGGSAGMTLARELSAQEKPPVTVVFEPKTPRQRDCCWSLWATEKQRQQLEKSTKGAWQQWRLVCNKEELILTSHNYAYTCLSSAAFLKSCEDSLTDPVKLKRVSVNQISDEGLVDAGDLHYRASHVFDSRPSSTDDGLKQHFLGWEVITERPIAEPEIATLMDFRVDQSRGLHFIYVLPFSATHLMIESTMISSTTEDKIWYRQAIEQWLQKKHIKIKELIREEVGVIPMQPPPISDDEKAQTITAIGAASGAVRLSSGYAFSTIQAQMTRLAENISVGNPLHKPQQPRFLNFMDKIFNAVLISRPDLAVSIFMRTAKALNGDEFSRFMLGSAGTLEWLKVILAMPKWPFIKQLMSVLKNDKS